MARKSNVNSDENVNQLADVLKNQDTRGRQIACKTSKLSSLRPKFQKKTLHSWTLKCTKVQDSTKNLSGVKCKHTTNLLIIFNTQISVGSKHLPGKKKGITQSISEPQESRRPTNAHMRTFASSGLMYDKYF